jgi:DNA-binding NarL/FixJ family response regulator
MREHSIRLGPREEQVVELLLRGYANADIALELKMARRTVKAHLSKLYLRFKITGGVRRVKLAIILHRRNLQSMNAGEGSSPETPLPAKPLDEA